MKPLAAHGPQRDHPIAPPPPTDRRTADKLHLRVGLGFPSRGVLLDRPLLLTPGIGNSVASACSPYTRRGFSSAFLLSSMPGGRRGVSGCPPPAPAPPRTPPPGRPSAPATTSTDLLEGPQYRMQGGLPDGGSSSFNL